MKYIRTEDGILKVDGYDDRGVCVCSGKTFYRDEYIKQANTIEELCDWFFLEGANGNPINYKKFYTAKRSKERMQIEHDLYGVIHIKGKGLIYVAKLNDNGELELL